MRAVFGLLAGIIFGLLIAITSIAAGLVLLPLRALIRWQIRRP
jgi:hypothetical protein